MKNFDSISPNPKSGPQIQISRTPSPLGQSFNSQRPRPGSLRGKKILKGILALILCAIIFLGFTVFVRARSLSGRIFVGQKTTFFGKVLAVLKNEGSQTLQTDNQGQINILLLGVGGQGHDGPYLTDTMILAQIRPDIAEVALTSIPRDYLVEFPGTTGKGKINAAFAEGFGKKKDYSQGGQWAISAAEKISGLKIPYFAVIDFQGFAKAVDQIGGINVTVERSFTDYQFPDDFSKDTKGFLPPISFTKGQETMNGQRALQFARSRHAEGPEGSDFARSTRQQKIIKAFKDKVLGLNMATDAGSLNRLLDIFADHFHTNLSPSEILKVYQIVKDKNIQTFLSLSLDPETRLICPATLPDTGAYVLVPCEGKTATDVENFFQNAFVLGRLAGEKATVWLSGNSKNPAAYLKAEKIIKDAGLTVWELPPLKEPLKESIVYTVNLKPATLEYLKNELALREVSLPPPGVKIDKTKVDIIVILGGNANSATVQKSP